jgi:hypothetical protein
MWWRGASPAAGRSGLFLRAADSRRREGRRPAGTLTPQLFGKARSRGWGVVNRAAYHLLHLFVRQE